MAQYKELQESLLAGEEERIKELISSLLSKGTKPLEIISDGLIHGMSLVGQKFKTGELFIPELLMSAHAMSAGMEILRPLIVGEKLSAIRKGKVVIGTVKGDVHNIGKNIVAMILETGGFEVVDIGVDAPPEKFVEAVKKERPNILGLSALLTTTMPNMKEVIDVLKQNKFRDRVRIMVGGAPITQSFADSIGADGYAPDAISALDKANQLLG